MSDLWTNPAFLVLIGAIPSFVLGFLGHRRSRAVDKTTEQTQLATNQIGSITQVIDGLNHLTDNLQEDNRLLREGMDGLNKLVEACRRELERIIQNQADLSKKLDR